MQNIFDEKSFYNEIARKINEEKELSLLDLEILFKGLRGNDKLKICTLYLLENCTNKKVISWLHEGLNNYFLFAPIYNINGACAFRIEERNTEFEKTIESVACYLHHIEEKEKE